MNICGCLLQSVPEKANDLRHSLEKVEGVEVHAQSEDGRFVVVVEDTTDRLASEIIMDLHQIPDVVSLTLNFHHFEETAKHRPPLRADTSKAGGQPHDHL